MRNEDPARVSFTRRDILTGLACGLTAPMMSSWSTLAKASSEMNEPARANYVGPKEPDIWVDANATGAETGMSSEDAFTDPNDAWAIAKPGDVVGLKEGVYRISMDGARRGTNSGEKGRPITFTAIDRDTVILSGGDPISATWKRCQSAEEAGGNKNYRNLWWVDLEGDDSPTGPLTYNLHQNGQQYYLPQSASGFYVDGRLDHDRLFGNFAVPYFRTSDSATPESLTDPEGLGAFQSFSDLENAYIIRHYHSGNNSEMLPITDFDAVGGTVFHEPARDSSSGNYTITNALKNLDGPGQFASRSIGRDKYRIWAWPFADPNDQPIDVGTRTFGLNIDVHNHIQFKGLIFQQYQNADQGPLVGSRTNVNTVFKEGIVFDSCTFRGMVSAANGGGASALSLVRCRNSSVVGCLIRRVQNCHGISVVVSGPNGNINISNNDVGYTGGTGIRPHALDHFVLAFNRVGEVSGGHGNGISIYGRPNHSSGMNGLIFGNYIRSGLGIPFTHQDSHNLYFLMNHFVCALKDGRGIDNNSNRDAGFVDQQLGPIGEIVYLNNTIVPDLDGELRRSHMAFSGFGNTGNTIHIALNNAFHGGLDPKLSRSKQGKIGLLMANVATGLSSSQHFDDLFFRKGAAIYNNIEEPNVYRDYTTYDLKPAAAGVLDGTGTNSLAIVSRIQSKFPEFDLSRYFNNASVDWHNVNIGAFG